MHNSIIVSNNKGFKDKIPFGTIMRDVYDQSGKLRYKNNSRILREDMNWNAYGNILLKEFPNGCNIHISACSDGGEVYSTMLGILKASNFDYGKLKKFRFIASDIDSAMVLRCKTGEISTVTTHNDIIYDDTEKLKEFMGENNFKEYFLPSSNLSGYTVSPKLTNLVDFRKADITEDATKKDFFGKGKCVVMFRNAWPYIKPAENQMKLALNLAENLPKGSMVVTGEFDTDLFRLYDKSPQRNGACGISELMTRVGFERSYIGDDQNCYRLPEKKDLYKIK